MLKAIKHKIIKALMFSALGLLLCAIGLLIAWLYGHGSSAAFELATGLLVSLPYIAWVGADEINRHKQGGAE